MKFKVDMKDVECSAGRNLTQATLNTLADCSFIRNGDNLLITGLTGCGKTYLACATGGQACNLGLRTLYLNVNSFIEDIMQAKLGGTMNKLIAKLNKNDLLILDDFGMVPLPTDVRITLLRILEDRYDRKSTIIVSQLTLDKWYDYLAGKSNDEMAADTIMDRLVNGAANHIDLKGESMRKRRRRV